MNNLLPEFQSIVPDEPATTQALAQLSIANTVARSSTPEVGKNKTTHAGVVGDLLNWAEGERYVGKSYHTNSSCFAIDDTH